MKYLWKAININMLILLITGCTGQPELFEVSKADQLVYFQFEYRNHAWGYQHHGWLIDSAGKVHCYDKPENWNFADSLSQISGAELHQNLLSADSVCYVLDEEVLESKVRQIEAASRGEISEPVHEMYDAGIGIYSAFVYNTKEDTYKKILLRQSGDFKVVNYAPAAIELHQWLEAINSLVQEGK